MLTHHKVHFTLEVPATSTIPFRYKSKLSSGSFVVLPPLSLQRFLTFKEFDSLMIPLNPPQKNVHVTQVYIELRGVHESQCPLAF